jgi:hypothetical protein
MPGKRTGVYLERSSARTIDQTSIDEPDVEIGTPNGRSACVLPRATARRAGAYRKRVPG